MGIDNTWNAVLFLNSWQNHWSEGEKQDSSERTLLLYKKENNEIVLVGIQLRKKFIDFRTMSDKILTRKRLKTEFQEDL